MWFWLAASTGQAALWGFTPERMCEVADVVVVAEVTSQEVQWDEGPTAGLTTTSWLWVDETLRGEVDPTLALVARGGRRGAHSQWVEHEAYLQVDRRYLLVLQERDGVYRVIAGELGAIPVPDAASLEAALSKLEGCR